MPRVNYKKFAQDAFERWRASDIQPRRVTEQQNQTLLASIYLSNMAVLQQLETLTAAHVDEKERKRLMDIAQGRTKKHMFMRDPLGNLDSPCLLCDKSFHDRTVHIGG